MLQNKNQQKSPSNAWQPWRIEETSPLKTVDHLDGPNGRSENNYQFKQLVHFLNSNQEPCTFSFSSTSSSSISNPFSCDDSDDVQKEPTDLSINTYSNPNTLFTSIPTPEMILNKLRLDDLQKSLESSPLTETSSALSPKIFKNPTFQHPSLLKEMHPVLFQSSFSTDKQPNLFQNEYLAWFTYFNRSIYLSNYDSMTVPSAASTPLVNRKVVSSSSMVILGSSSLNSSTVTLTPATGEYQTPPRCNISQNIKNENDYNNQSINRSLTITSDTSSNFHPTDLQSQFTCQVCKKSYHQHSALKMHIRTHTLPCQCKYCGKSFSRKWLLKGHERTHTGERPYQCLTCLRSFADRSNLRAHMQTHQSDKRYKCPKCSRSFSRIGLLKKHLNQSTPCRL